MNMKKTTANIIYLYNNIVECVMQVFNNPTKSMDDYFLHINEVDGRFDVKVVHESENYPWSKYCLCNFEIVDYIDENTGDLESCVSVKDVALIIDDWFECNK